LLSEWKEAGGLKIWTECGGWKRETSTKFLWENFYTDGSLAFLREYGRIIIKKNLPQRNRSWCRKLDCSDSRSVAI